MSIVDPGELPLTLTTEQVALFAQAGGSYPSVRTVSLWAKKGLLLPSIAGPRGRRHDVAWSPEDAVCVRSLARLREANCADTVAATWVKQHLILELASGPPARMSVLVDKKQKAATTVHPDGSVGSTLPSVVIVELAVRDWLDAAYQLTGERPTLF